MAKKTISNTFTVNTLIDGESVFDASLDHNVIGVECDTEGNISETVSFLVAISAHYGSENVVGACTITDNHEDVDSDIIVTYAPSPSHTSEPWVAKITFTQGNGLAPMLNMAFTVFHPTYGTRVISLSLNRIVMGKDGRNSIRLDLNNESDTMLYDGAGNLLSDSVSTMATLYDGGTDVSNYASFSIQGYSGMDSTKVSISGRTVTVSGMTSGSGYVDISASYKGNDYTHRFTLKKIVGVDKFDIVVSPNAISINTSDTTFADTPISVQVYRTPSNGGARQLVSWENVQGTYNAFGLVLAVKDSENNSLVETTSGTPVTTRTFNFSATQAQNVDITDVTVLLGKRFASQTPITQDMETIPVSHVRNGQDGTGANAVRIDLSNEMDSIPTDVDGKVLSTVYLSTDARIYNGATPETSGVNAVSVGRIANIQGTVNGSVPPVSNLTDGLGNVRWVIPANTVLTADKYRAQIQFQVNNIPYFAYFTATVVKSGEEGVSPEILSLLPSPNQIIFSKDSSGTIPSTSKTLSLKIKKTIGNTTEVKDVDQSGLTIRYSTVAMPATVSDGTAWSGDISIQSTVTYSNVYIAAFDGNTLVDTETIPIIKDGVDGVDYIIQSSIESIKIPSNQTSTSKAVTFKFYSKAGGADKQAFDTYFTIYTRNNSGFYSLNYPPISSLYHYTSVSRTFNSITTNVSAIVIYIWGANSSSVPTGNPQSYPPENYPYLAKFEIPIIKDGDDGQAGARGALGRSYYYAGEFNSQDESKHYVVNDAQSPFFLHIESGQKRYHVFNPAESPQSGDMTMKEMWEESDGNWNNAPWEVMNNDFKYLITQAIFGAYAHLGSWIFNNDYMLSEKDKDGVPRGQRAYNGMDDNQLTTGFIPSIAFDALNGRASFGGDTVRFQPDGAGWLANKSIIWDADGNASFSGFIKKTPTYITPENESEYIINYFSTLYTFDFQKTGTFVVLQPNVGHDTLHLPCLYQYVAHYYSDEQKMIIRSYVGTKVLIYNASGHGLSITYMYDSNGGSYADVLGNGYCATVECKIRKESGFENVYWEIVQCGSII